MFKKKIVLVALVITVFATLPLFSKGGDINVVATNKWTAEFARIAGAKNITLLAPVGVVHPPEYEVTLEQLQTIAQSDFVVCAGYEKMMGRIKSSLGDNSTVQIVQIRTDNSYAVIEKSVLTIAKHLGTTQVAKKNLLAYKEFFLQWKKEVSALGIANHSVVTHKHCETLVRGVGIQPRTSFGPAAPTLAQISKVLSAEPTIIVDNYHNKLATPFLEHKSQPALVEWINFPGTKNTKTLMELLHYNRRVLKNVLQQ